MSQGNIWPIPFFDEVSVLVSIWQPWQWWQCGGVVQV